jgi:hypothetical protein
VKFRAPKQFATGCRAGTSWPDGKLTGDLGKSIEAVGSTNAGKLSPGNFGLLQHKIGTKCECRSVSYKARSVNTPR